MPRTPKPQATPTKAQSTRTSSRITRASPNNQARVKAKDTHAKTASPKPQQAPPSVDKTGKRASKRRRAEAKPTQEPVKKGRMTRAKSAKSKTDDDEHDGSSVRSHRTARSVDEDPTTSDREFIDSSSDDSKSDDGSSSSSDGGSSESEAEEVVEVKAKTRSRKPKSQTSPSLSSTKKHASKDKSEAAAVSDETLTERTTSPPVPIVHLTTSGYDDDYLPMAEAPERGGQTAIAVFVKLDPGSRQPIMNLLGETKARQYATHSESLLKREDSTIFILDLVAFLIMWSEFVTGEHPQLPIDVRQQPPRGSIRGGFQASH